MSLRIVRGSGVALRGEDEGDGYASRLAKLIPAEALGLYGAGQVLVPEDRLDGRIFLAVVCMLLAGYLRYQATKGDSGRPQWPAVGIAVVSFLLWLLALKPPTGVVDLGRNAFYAALFALIWGTVLPQVYKGSPAQDL